MPFTDRDARLERPGNYFKILVVKVVKEVIAHYVR